MFSVIIMCHFAVKISITVHTSIFTGIIHTYVNTFYASTNSSLVFVFSDFKLIISYFFEALLINAACMCNIYRGKKI